MNINKIKLSGQTYNIQDENASKTVELTQAQYDALAVKDPNTFYIITDATGGDLSNYYTKSETSGATQISTALASKQTTLTAGTNITIVDNVISATGGGGGGSSYQAGDGIDITNDVISVTGKVDTSTYNTYTAATDTALASKQDTLVSGTNIKTINNESILGSGNITIEGGGGGKAIEAGRGISITTGETADTVSFNLPISGLPKTTTAVTDNNLVIFGTGNTVDIESKTQQNLDSNIVYGNNNVLTLSGIKCSLQYNTIFGQGNEIANDASLNASSNNNFVFGSNNKVYGNTNKYNLLFGDNNQMQGGQIHITVFGTGNEPKNQYETIFGKYSVSHSGSTNADKSLFSVGNGTSSAATHNAFEIRQNGDIYLTLNGQDVKLQDQLGGGGSTYTAGDGINITNDVISVTGKVDTSAITTSITSANTNTQLPSAKAVYDQLGGLKLVKLSQSAYDALSTKDSNTLYVIEEAPECNTPSTATWHDVDTSFDRTTQIYGIDFGSGDGGNDGAGRDYQLQVKNANNTIYDITCHLKDRNAELGGSDSIVISNADGTTYRQLDNTAIINSFCEIFGEPMYISANATIPSYEQCVDEQCTEYECLQYDEETGECIEQGAGCISSECMQYQTTYFITVLY